MISFPSTSLWIVIASLAVAMTIGTGLRFFALRTADAELRHKRLSSLCTWWVLAFVLSLSVATGRLGVCLLLCSLSCVGIREYAALVGRNKEVNRLACLLYVLAIATYALILTERRDAVLVLYPVAALLLIPVIRLTHGGHEDYIRTVGGLVFAGLTVIFGLAHAAYLFILPEASSGVVGPAGWFLFLVILTESNDIAQAIVGRKYGAHKRHRLAPTISPNKTWEGLVGGMIVTVILAMLLAPWLTGLYGPMFQNALFPPALLAAIIGGLTCVFGLFGDLNMSAAKRDAGVKDSSRLLPGMGGLLDRIDSLTFTAPVLIYFLVLVT